MPTMARPFALLAASAVLSGAFAATPKHQDACAKVANQTFSSPADALACYKSFPFNETLRDNVVSAVSRIFDFYTFEDYYYKSPPPFQESTVNIRGELARISKAKYSSDYEFNSDVYNMTTILNDGHTRWFPNCYQVYESLLPAPIAILEMNGKEGVYVVPDLTSFIPLLGSGYTQYLSNLKFNWQRLAGAEVLDIEGQSAYDYIDYVAHTQSGNYLDHGIRVNSVVSSYRISGNAYGQRFGDLAGTLTIEKPGLTLNVILANTTKPQKIFVPYVTEYIGTANFTNSPSFWAANCAATPDTNGQDYYPDGSKKREVVSKRRAMANLIDNHNASAVGLPTQYQPGLPTVGGSEGVIRSYILPGNTTGVMFVGSFEPDDYNGFQADVDSAVKTMKAAGVKKLLVDLTNNGGGYICLGQFLHQYLAGSNIGYPGFQTTLRANTLAKQVLAAQIARGEGGNYYPNGFAFLNDTVYPDNYNYFKPSLPVVVNGRSDPTSQRSHDICTPFNVTMPKTPPFALKNVALVSNGNCASTCAQFSTLMYEHYKVKIATFGGKPGEPMEYKGMAGNQVLEFADLKSEIKTARLNNSTLAPPDLLVNGNMRVNWRTAWSFLDESIPIAYLPERAHYRFPYTDKTYNNPEAVWTYAAKQLLN